jgi:hypothetical protein
MAMRPRPLIIALAAVGLLACGRGGLPREKVEAWVGRPAAELIREWGLPTKELTDGGQRVLIYEEVERSQATEFSRDVSPRLTREGLPTPNAVTTGTSSYARSYLFWVDGAGQVVRTEIRQP